MRRIVRPGDGGEIDTQPGSELAMGRQALPGAQAAGLDVPGDRLGDIEVDRTLAACRQGGQPRLWLFFGILLQSELVSIHSQNNHECPRIVWRLYGSKIGRASCRERVCQYV